MNIIKLIITAIIQSAFLGSAQIFMKLGMAKVGDYVMSWSYFRSYMNWQLGISLVLYVIAMIIYMLMLRTFNVSIVYPLTSISYIFTMLMAKFFLGEFIEKWSWLGVLFVMLGVGLIAMQTKN